MDSTKFNTTLLFVRSIIAIIVAAHGAQKLFGWFGGFGYDGTMGFFTGVIGLPYLLALSIILLESIGMVALLFGLLTRFISAGIVIIMIGAIITTHAPHGFFMNWFGAQAGEGYEYHLLIIALSLVSVINGGGAYSIDGLLKTKFGKSVNPSSESAIA